MKDRVRQIIVVLATLLVIAINSLASARGLNGQTTGEISDRFDVYFVPAGYVFAIWGLIYLGLIAFTVFQALPAQRDNPRLSRVGYVYALSCLANVGWLFFWHYEVFVGSLAAMVVLLALLVAIYLRLGTGATQAANSESWLVRIPFSIYLGWITVATIANVTSLLEYLNWGGWGISPEVWAVLMVIAAGVVASAVSFTRGDIGFVLVVVWALIGIAVKQRDTPLVAVTAGFVAGFILGTLLVGVPRVQERLTAWTARPPQVGIRDRW